MNYKTPRALEQAVKEAVKKSGRDVNKGITGFYHDRFLCRVFAAEEPAFILKGGQSMLAKVPDARETRDIDLLGRTADLDRALDELKSAAAIDLDDFVEFRFRDAVPTDTSQDYREGYTVRFDTWLGGTKHVGVISVDLVVDPMPLEEYEVLSPAARLDVPGLKTFDYVANTPATRVAEKTCAVMQRYATGPSSRVKDLADLVTSMLNERIDAAPRATQHRYRRERRGLLRGNDHARDRQGDAHGRARSDSDRRYGEYVPANLRPARFVPHRHARAGRRAAQRDHVSRRGQRVARAGCRARGSEDCSSSRMSKPSAPCSGAILPVLRAEIVPCDSRTYVLYCTW